MNPEDKIKALAELDGIEFQAIDGITRWRYEDGTWNIFQLPNYLGSYDAIIPLIQKRTKELTMPILINDYLPDGVYFHSATPAQLSEALLRATGRWIE